MLSAEPSVAPRDAAAKPALIEEVRIFWDHRPCNLRHSPEPVGTRAYFDQVEARKYFVEPHIPSFADFARWSGRRVLEIGCGIGTDTINFARHGARVTAVDLSARSLDLARQRAEIYGLSDRIRFHAGDAERLSDFVPVEPYDLLYAFGVIHHTPHPAQLLGELARYAHPESTLKVMLYHRHALKVLGVMLTGGGRFWQLPALVARHSEAQAGCPVTWTYSRRQARDLLERAGFRVTDVRVEHIFPYRVADYVQYRYVKSPAFRWMPAPAFRWLEARVGWHLCLAAAPAGT